MKIVGGLLFGEINMAIEINIGSKIWIDGEINTVVSLSEVLDGDFDYGNATKKKIATLRSKSGFEIKIMQEVEE